MHSKTTVIPQFLSVVMWKNTSKTCLSRCHYVYLKIKIAMGTRTDIRSNRWGACVGDVHVRRTYPQTNSFQPIADKGETSSRRLLQYIWYRQSTSKLIFRYTLMSTFNWNIYEYMEKRIQYSFIFSDHEPNLSPLSHYTCILQRYCKVSYHVLPLIMFSSFRLTTVLKSVVPCSSPGHVQFFASDNGTVKCCIMLFP